MLISTRARKKSGTANPRPEVLRIQRPIGRSARRAA
jgi:hypothetical protein